MSRDRKYTIRCFTVVALLCWTSTMPTSVVAAGSGIGHRIQLLSIYDRRVTRITSNNPSCYLQHEPPFMRLRGGSISGGIRFAPPIVSASSKTAPPTTTTTSTVTEVKEQIDVFLTRDSRNTFIGKYANRYCPRTLCRWLT